jgi:hypothetical protein
MMSRSRPRCREVRAHAVDVLGALVTSVRADDVSSLPDLG